MIIMFLWFLSMWHKCAQITISGNQKPYKLYIVNAEMVENLYVARALFFSFSLPSGLLRFYLEENYFEFQIESFDRVRLRIYLSFSRYLAQTHLIDIFEQFLRG